MAEKVKTPARLQAAGRALWAKLTTAYEFDVWELAIVEAIARQADDVARLERLIAEHGVTSVGSKGQPRLAPAVTEVRQGRLALTKMLGELRIPSEEDERPMSTRSRNAKRAADARWDRAREMREAL